MSIIVMSKAIILVFVEQAWSLLPWKEPGTTDEVSAPMELSLHVPLLRQEKECFRHP